MTLPDRLVFDAEPLVAHADGEPGSAAVDDYLTAVADGETQGYLCHVNAAEVRYILASVHDREVADAYLDWVYDLGVRPVGVDGSWTTASEYVIEHNPALGDAFALAAAENLDATLLVGADDDYDDVDEVRIERFRDEPA